MAENTPSVTLVGNTLAVLVAAAERTQRGLPTRIISPGGPWGGYFAGVNAGGRLWDAGMVLYEFTSFRDPGTPPDLATYEATRRNDIGRFCGVVRDHVAQFQRTQVVSTPLMHLGGQWLPDLMLSNQLDALQAMPERQLLAQEMRQQGWPAADSAPQRWHPRHKQQWPADGTDGHGRPVTFDEVSRQVHGHGLHDAVMVPFIRKVMNQDDSGLAALYHRMTWLPLFWPETTLSWLEGEGQALPPTLFHQPVDEPVAALCQRLVALLNASPLVRIDSGALPHVRRTRTGFELTLPQGLPEHTDRLGWALTPRQGLQACGLPVDDFQEDRLPVTLMFLRMAAQDVQHLPSVLHCLDACTGAYRVSSAVSTPEARRDGLVDLVVEANPHHFDAVHGAGTDDARTVAAACHDLHTMGVLHAHASPRFSKVMRLAGALPLPTHRSLHHYQQEHETLRQACPGIELIGPSAGPFANSLSEQIIQGLCLARASLSTSLPEPEGMVH